MPGMGSSMPDAPAPLATTPFHKLALGSIRAGGWLRDQLLAQKAGLSGHLDPYWLHDDWWVGGHGRNGATVASKPHIAPNFIEGLIPLAVALDDRELLEQARPYIEFAITSQRASGYFGPAGRIYRNLPVEKPMERYLGERYIGPPATSAIEAVEPVEEVVGECSDLGRSRMLRALIAWQECTGDARVLPLIQRYVGGVLGERMGEIRGFINNCNLQENLVGALWAYARSQDPAVLAVCRRLAFEPPHYNGDWQRAGRQGEPVIDHGYAVAHGLKYPQLHYLLSGDAEDLAGTGRLLAWLDQHHGQLDGRFAAHEALPKVAGRLPTNGTELCTVVETMYSLEFAAWISGDPAYMDRLETIAYNSLPATISGDCWAHQYDQQTNQVACTVGKRRFDNRPDANCFGLAPNYDCCLGNLHQGWPRLVEHLWLASNDGIACVSYAPCTVEHQGLRFTVSGDYPFTDVVNISIKAADRPYALHLRRPAGASGFSVSINGGEPRSTDQPWMVLQQSWQAGDTLTLHFDLPIRHEPRADGAIAVRRGALYFALPISMRPTCHTRHFLGAADWEFHPDGPWQYALDLAAPATLEQHPPGALPFAARGEPLYNPATGQFHMAPASEPVRLRLSGRLLANWGFDPAFPGLDAAPVPSELIPQGDPVELELVPYGCTRLRIAEFPSLRKEEGLQP